jgi:hypothetical protein
VVAIQEMGGPVVPWRPGRTDAASGAACTPDGRLPDASKKAGHLRDIFYRMGACAGGVASAYAQARTSRAVRVARYS